MGSRLKVISSEFYGIFETEVNGYLSKLDNEGVVYRVSFGMKDGFHFAYVNEQCIESVRVRESLCSQDCQFFERSCRIYTGRSLSDYEGKGTAFCVRFDKRIPFGDSCCSDFYKFGKGSGT